jgi:REP element-mobilizing transposase RayT
MSDHVIKRHNKNLLLYHVVCPVKYRRDVFTPEVTITLKESCLGIEQRYEIGYHEIGTDEDHVHFLIQAVPEYAPSRIVQITKSITAKLIFAQHVEVKRKLWGGQFWTKGYYINTVGQYGSEAVIRRYVQNQGRTYEQIYANNTLSLFT